MEVIAAVLGVVAVAVLAMTAIFHDNYLHYARFAHEWARMAAEHDAAMRRMADEHDASMRRAVRELLGAGREPLEARMLREFARQYRELLELCLVESVSQQARIPRVLRPIYMRLAARRMSRP